MTIQEYINRAHANARNKGFWDVKFNLGEKLMLIVSEIGEALEADRKGRRMTKSVIEDVYNLIENKDFSEYFEVHGKDTFEDEICDVFIRLFDLCGGMDIDIEKHIEMKMKYNKKRARLHGKKY